MEVRHNILTLFMIHFNISRISIIVSDLYKSETSYQNKEVRQEYLPLDFFLQLVFSFWFMCSDTSTTSPSKVFLFSEMNIADCIDEMQIVNFLHSALHLHFRQQVCHSQTDTCDVKNNDKDLLAMPAASSQCKTNGQIFINYCNEFGKDKSHNFVELPLFH